MRNQIKFSVTSLLLMICTSLFAQFEKTQYTNVITFDANEEITSKFNTSGKLWRFNMVADSLIVVTPCSKIDANYYAFAIYDNLKFKGAYSFEHTIQTDVVAYHKDDIYFTTGKVQNDGVVLCKFNVKTEENTYISLPESLKSFFAKYEFSYFSFDKTTSKVYFYITLGNGTRYVFSYNLATDEFSDKWESVRMDYHLFTVNNFHYFHNSDQKVFSIKIDDPSAKPKKLPVETNQKSAIISADEVAFYTRGVGDETEYTIIKNGDVNKKNKKSYESLINSLRYDFFGGGESPEMRFCFNYSAPGQYSQLKTSKGYYSGDYGSYNPLLKPGLFLLVYQSKSYRDNKFNSTKTYSKVTNEKNETKSEPTESYARGVLVYKGISSYDLVVEIEAEARYKIKRTGGMLSFNYIDVAEAKGVRFRYPQNSSTWYSFSANGGDIYPCSDGYNCISIEGMSFVLSSPVIK